MGVKAPPAEAQACQKNEGGAKPTATGGTNRNTPSCKKKQGKKTATRRPQPHPSKKETGKRQREGPREVRVGGKKVPGEK